MKPMRAGQQVLEATKAMGLGAWVLAVAGSLAAEPTVIIVSPHTEAIRHEFGLAFGRWHAQHHAVPAIVEWRDAGGTSDALRYVQSEFSRKPEGIGIDLFFGGGQEPYLILADKKLSLRHQPPAEILQGIPQNINGVEVYDPDLRWFGAALSSFGILQNTRVQRWAGLPAVTRWEELTRPELYDWVGVGDPRNSGTMNVMLEAFLQAYGWERGWQILTQLGGNARRFDRLSSSTAKNVTLGDTAYGFAIDFYGFTQIAVAGRTNMTFVLPRDFTSVNPDGIAILKGAPNLETARRFVDFVLSEDGQRLWFLPRGHPQGPQAYSIERMSIRPEFYRRYRDVSNIQFSPFDLDTPFRYDPKVARSRRQVVQDLVGTLLVDTHTELRAAWRAIIRRGLAAADLARLGSAPISEPEGFALAAGDWQQPGVRNRIRIAWQTWAQEKYRALAAQGSAADNAPSPRAPASRTTAGAPMAP
jgi:ABC-type Fe3+ transport system substrate-binding protein